MTAFAGDDNAAPPPSARPPALPGLDGPVADPEGMRGVVEGEGVVAGWRRATATMSDAVYRELCHLIHERFGIAIRNTPKNLIAGRLAPLLATSGCPTFDAFLSLLWTDTSGLWISELANRVTTNHTSFFREMPHFDFLLHEALPAVERRKKSEGSNDLRIWCAACATGEEPYSIAVYLLRYFGTDYANWQAGVLATDISDAALARARLGVYPPTMMRHIPLELRGYFTKMPTNEWQVNDEVRAEVTFRRFNLMKPQYPFRVPFDIIFCRNVMIYFDAPTRDALIAKLYEWTAPGGFLLVGHAESFDRRHTPYRYLRPAVYQRVDDDTAASAGSTAASVP